MNLYEQMDKVEGKKSNSTLSYKRQDVTESYEQIQQINDELIKINGG